MPVLTKTKHDRLLETLAERYYALQKTFLGRPLTSQWEGLPKKQLWTNPDNMSATVGSADELRMAVADFKTILDEIKRLK